MQGGGTLTLTGHLGDVMKESARTALSWFRAHAHALRRRSRRSTRTPRSTCTCPSGAIPKDGPSAGVTMVTALASELTGRPVRGDLAMTGEITLSGRVLPVGGIKEKVLAARRHGITRGDPAAAEREEHQGGPDRGAAQRADDPLRRRTSRKCSRSRCCRPPPRRTPGCRSTRRFDRRCSSSPCVEPGPGSHPSTRPGSPTAITRSALSADHRLHVDDLAAPHHVARVARARRSRASMSSSSSSAAASVGLAQARQRKKTISSSQ